MRVLLVENGTAAARDLNACLATNGLRADMTNTGEGALELLRLYEFDIVVLHLQLPDIEGSRLILRMRRERLATPVLALTSRVHNRARMDALTAGADDVVDEHVDRAELVARMRAIVRRSRGYSDATLRVGALTLNLERHEVLANGNYVQLTGKEFEILQLLMLRKNMVLTKEAILGHIYAGMDEPDLKIIDVFICKMRKKLAQAGLKDAVGTVWGRGYTIQDTGRDNRAPVTPPMPQPTHSAPRSRAFA